MEYLMQLDSSILLWIQEHIRHDFLDWFWVNITTLGDTGWFWLVASVLMLLFKKTRAAGIVSLCSIALCFLITNVGLKNLVGRPRPYTQLPELFLMIPPESDLSFPSGHTTVSFAAACIYVRMLPKKFGIPAVVLAALISLSRLYVGVHYPLDVLGGLLAALIGSMIAYQAYLTIRDRRRKKGYGKSQDSQMIQ